MPLSARRLRRREVVAGSVGLPTRLLASLLDCLLPTAGLIVFVETGNLRLDHLQPQPDIFVIDRALLYLYEQPTLVLYAPFLWMLIWSAVSLVTLGFFQTSLGKWALGLELRQRDGAVASGLRLLLRIAVSWTIPFSLGLAYLWIAVSPERRAWHDSLSGTFVVRVEGASSTTRRP